MSSWMLLEGDPAPGDPSAVSALARQFRQAAEEFDEGRGRVTRMMATNSLPSWMGPAATAFAGGLEPLRDDLRQAAASFDVAATALSTYVRVLDALQTRARSLLAQAIQAQQRIDAANLSLSRVSANVDQTIASQGLDPLAAMIYRRQTLAPHHQAIRDAEAALRAIRSQAQDLRREHEAAARTAADGFGRATKVGIHETWRDGAIAILTEVNHIIDDLKPVTTVIAVTALAVFVVVATGGLGAGAVAAVGLKAGIGIKAGLGLKGKVMLASKANALISGADVSARISRRVLGDETMTDSNAKLGVDATLVAVGLFVVPKAGHAATGQVEAAMDTVRTAGYHTGTYQTVNAAYQSVNQVMALHMVKETVSLIRDVPVTIERMTGGAKSHSLYEPPVSPLPAPATPPAVGGTPPIVGQTSTDTPLQASFDLPPLQASLDALALRAGDGPIPGLRQLDPVVHSTCYRFPIDVRK